MKAVVGSLVLLRGTLYTLASVVAIAWWVFTGFGATFAGSSLPFWALLPASCALAASIYMHRVIRVRWSAGFLPTIIATEVMLWTAVIALGLRPGFLLWGLAQIGGIVLAMPSTAVEVRLRRQGFWNEEFAQIGTENATFFAIAFSVIAIIVGAVVLDQWRQRRRSMRA